MFKKLLVAIFVLSSIAFYGQTTVTGKVYDEYLEPFPSASINSVNGQTTSDNDGNFTFTVKSGFPFSIQVSAFGYKTEVVEITSANQEINVILKENTALDEVVISASRSPERIIESPVTIERIGITDIKRNTSVSFYDGLANLKGIESRESNYGYKAINSRGFATFDNTRFVQLVDGVETSIPALNFSAGNILGLSDLDVKSVEILPGASSALYGANAFNGILLMRSKNPFDHSGISTYFKTGQMTQEAAGTNWFYDVGVRMAYKFSDYFAAKVNFTTFKAEEWHANDDANTTGVGGVKKEGDRDSHPDYDGVNFYGDEVVFNIPGIGRVSRTGYAENELYDYDGHNVKFDGSLHYRPMGNDKLELIFSSRFSQGNNSYQGTNRFSQEGYFLEQHKLEVVGKNFFIRGYYTGNDSGDRTHDLRFAGVALNEKYNPTVNWFGEYATAYSGGVPGVTPGNDKSARDFADRNRLQPGTSEFKNALNEIIATPINDGGAGIKDKTGYYHADANYNFRDLISWAEIQVGGSYRKFNINSQGTLFTDKDSPINFDMYGAYSQIQKSFLDERAKLTASIRYDKAKNFEGNYSPRVALTYDVGGSKNKIIRASYQTGFRNPSIPEQYFGLRSGPNRFILGTSEENLTRFNAVVTNSGTGAPATSIITGTDAFSKSYTKDSYNQFLGVLIAGGAPALPTAIASLDQSNVKPVEAENVKSYELGYRSIINIGSTNILELDLSGYYNQYENFVAFKDVVVPNYGSIINGIPDAQARAALVNRDVTEVTLNTNSTADIDSYGVGIGLSTKVFKSFNFGANYTYSKLVFDQASDPSFQPGFNIPEHQLKVMFGNPNLFENFGFNINARWQNEFLWQSSFLDAQVDARTVLDAQMNYRIPSLKSKIKIGGTNLTGKEYVVAPGSGLIGSVYYISWTIND